MPVIQEWRTQRSPPRSSTSTEALLSRLVRTIADDSVVPVSVAVTMRGSRACVTSLQTLLSATVARCTVFHVLPNLQELFVVCSPLSSLSQSAGPPTRQDAPPLAPDGLLVLHCRSHSLRALRVEVVDSMSPVFSWETTPSTGITSLSGCLRGLKTESNCKR